MGVLQSIREGKYDTILDSIVREVNNRKVRRLDDLHVGSKVRISRNTRPAYIAGRVGKIMEFRRSRILVMLEPAPPMGTRFSRGILCHPQSLEPVE